MKGERKHWKLHYVTSFAILAAGSGLMGSELGLNIQAERMGLGGNAVTVSGNTSAGRGPRVEVYVGRGGRGGAAITGRGGAATTGRGATANPGRGTAANPGRGTAANPGRGAVSAPSPSAHASTAPNLVAGEEVGILTPGLVIGDAPASASTRWRTPVFSPTGQDLAAVRDGGNVGAECVICNLTTHKPTAMAPLTIPANTSPVLHFWRDAKSIYATFEGAGADAGPAMAFWTGGAMGKQGFVNGPSGTVNLAVQFVPGVPYALVADGLGVKKQTLRVDATDHLIVTPGEVVLTVGRPLRTPAAFSADGTTFGAVEDSGELTVWDLSRGQARFHVPALPEGAFSLLGFSQTGKSVFTAAKGGNTVHMLDGVSGSEERKISLPGGATVECMACTADGKYLAVGGGNVIRLWAADKGLEIVALPVDGGGGHDVSFSADGQYLAAGSDDGTMRLWRVSSYTGQAPAHTVAATKPGAATTPAAAPDLRPMATTVDDEQMYLFWGARRFLLLAEELAGHEGTAEALASLRRQAGARAEYLAGRSGAAARVAAIYQALPGAIDQLAVAEQSLRAAYADYARRTAAATAQFAEKRHEQVMQGKVAGLLMLLGALESHEAVYVNSHEYYIDTGPAIPGLFEYALGEMFSSAMSLVQIEQQITAAKNITDGALHDAKVRALQEKADAYKKIEVPWLALAPSFGIEGLEPLTPEQMQLLLADAGRLKALMDLLGQEEKWEQGKGSRANPFTLARKLMIQGRLPGQTPQTLFSAANELAGSVKLVPPGKLFDADRAKLLELASNMALQAADREGPETGRAKADYAWSMLQAARAMDPGALDASVERLLIAGIRNGHGTEVLTTAQETVRRDPTSAWARYMLARVEYGLGDRDDGLDQLEYAVKHLGYHDMAAVLGSPEFASRSERFKAITAINVSVRADPQANTVLVTNQSLFALENVKMDWQYTLVENKPAPAPTPAQPRRSARPTASPLLLQKYDVVETVYRLEPGKTYALFTDRATKGTITTTDTIDARKLTVPKATVTVTSSSIGATTVEVPH